MAVGRITGFLNAATVFSFAAVLTVQPPLKAADDGPVYTLQSIVNAATQTAGPLAPNTIATIYGSRLAFSTRTAETLDLKGNLLPTTLDGVTVYVNGISGGLFYISPTQINFLVPYELTAGSVNVTVARQGHAGPTVKVQLEATSPGLFQWSGNYAIASHLTGKIVGPDTPAKAGEIVVLYAVGLGRTSPDTVTGRIVSSAAKIVALAQLRITIAGDVVPAANILYAGLAPGFAGLYQVNLKMPDVLPPDPEIRISVGPQASLPRVQLAALAAGSAAN